MAEMDPIQDDDLLPMIHLEDLYEDPSTLSSVLRTHGSFYLLDPPLPPSPWEAVARLFALPQEGKHNLKNPKGSQIRGYNSDPRSGREWWDLTPESPDGCAGPPDDDGFKDATKEYFSAAVKLLSALTEVLMDAYPSIPESALEQGMSTMRLLRYSSSLIPPLEDDAAGTPAVETHVEPPPTPADEDEAKQLKRQHTLSEVSRMQPHTDHGVLTLMDADSRGLYLYGPSGKLYAAPPVKNAVIVFAADSLCWFTRGHDDGGQESIILPVPHEVWMHGEQERMSLAVFFRPHNDVVLYDDKGKGKGKGSEAAAATGGEEAKEGEKKELTYGRWSYEKGRIKGRRCWLYGREVQQETAAAAATTAPAQ